ncbi:hypothetical protein [Nitratireductor sp. ZSWI3]|uniref:hypothetical protein n=1 Tax=Nitratireductor sp. ZSWI3 TaxID=2966359 RepID=UPI00214FF846|nr:hypothetical protein [Nitratireductor sp. ZSWI3]MCR4264837.1 hypothetical protein [Nitratireductor sp. ZSWI3]
MTEEAAEIDQQELFLWQPSRYADPARLISCFGGAVDLETGKRLLATRRLDKRLSRLLTERFHLPPPALQDNRSIDEADWPVACAPADRLAEIAIRAGAVYWAATLARTISGREATALREQLGAALCSLAVANKDLAGPQQPLDPLETVRQRVEADGWVCLAAWCEAAGPVVASRVRLKLPPQNPLEAPAAPAFAEIGPLIVRRVAG